MGADYGSNQVSFAVVTDVTYTLSAPSMPDIYIVDNVTSLEHWRADDKSKRHKEMRI